MPSGHWFGGGRRWRVFNFYLRDGWVQCPYRAVPELELSLLLHYASLCKLLFVQCVHHWKIWPKVWQCTVLNAVSSQILNPLTSLLSDLHVHCLLWTFPVMEASPFLLCAFSPWSSASQGPPKLVVHLSSMPELEQKLLRRKSWLNYSS